MTERKPPETSWETWVEAQIRVAIEDGAFDNLPGAGKPLPNYGQEYDPLWWQKQLVQREQITMLPPSLELLRKVETELAAIEKLPDEATLRCRVVALKRRPVDVQPADEHLDAKGAALAPPRSEAAVVRAPRRLSDDHGSLSRVASPPAVSAFSFTGDQRKRLVVQAQG